MKKVFLILFLSQMAVSQAQEMTYKYVKVPEKFEFLKEENKFQVNALTAFLFEKYGFEAIYKEKTPAGVDPCEILHANVENKSGLFRTKLQVNLEDCNQRVVFTSEEGMSREKDYKTSYHEALREAFQSLENFTAEMPGHAQNISESSVTEESSVQIKDTSGEEPQQVGITITSKELSRDKTLRNGGQVYQLKQDSSGYSLFREGEEEKFGSLIKSGSGSNYIYSSKNLQGSAFFDAAGNLIVEYVDVNTGQLVSVNYELQD
ncbi:hypothetical protein GCM10007103_22820 [Salinimicrobium marinum]|uniref:Secreted protein n=1 Tax=Salinimicrobium marinum TaxID=680283 RepID=A0A918W0J3_9FLAO|nr:hypothetical protein [Salinimicrobium marinum]GHA40909.1 hypothetical protein GCM10007103_22820 [Salinimicrobium marinum]